ncbi:hypothetical protein DAI22_07g078200 [Oryza sativa Japonica Group]|nr:hypothetical protein DAI22_07g078200 [Oryza sativa Japonica Group]
MVTEHLLPTDNNPPGDENSVRINFLMILSPNCSAQTQFVYQMQMARATLLSSSAGNFMCFKFPLKILNVCFPE